MNPPSDTAIHRLLSTSTKPPNRRSVKATPSSPITDSNSLFSPDSRSLLALACLRSAFTASKRILRCLGTLKNSSFTRNRGQKITANTTVQGFDQSSRNAGDTFFFDAHTPTTIKDTAPSAMYHVTISHIFLQNVRGHARRDGGPENQQERCPPSYAPACSLLDVLPLAVWVNYPSYGWGISNNALAMVISMFLKDRDEQLRVAIDEAMAAGYLVVDSDGLIGWVWPSQPLNHETTEETSSTQ